MIDVTQLSWTLRRSVDSGAIGSFVPADATTRAFARTPTGGAMRTLLGGLADELAATGLPVDLQRLELGVGPDNASWGPSSDGGGNIEVSPRSTRRLLTWLEARAADRTLGAKAHAQGIEGVRTLVHEAQHAVTPGPVDHRYAAAVAEEGAAELLSDWPGVVERVAGNLVAGQTVPAPTPDSYPNAVERMSTLLRLAGVSPDDPAARERAVGILQGGPRSGVYRRLGRAIAAHHDLGAGGSARVQQAIGETFAADLRAAERLEDADVDAAVMRITRNGSRALERRITALASARPGATDTRS